MLGLILHASKMKRIIYCSWDRRTKDKTLQADLKASCKSVTYHLQKGPILWASHCCRLHWHPTGPLLAVTGQYSHDSPCYLVHFLHSVPHKDTPNLQPIGDVTVICGLLQFLLGLERGILPKSLYWVHTVYQGTSLSSSRSPCWCCLSQLFF